MRWCSLRVAASQLLATVKFYEVAFGMSRRPDEQEGRARLSFADNPRSCGLELLAVDTTETYKSSRDDAYWKVGMAMDDVNAVADFLRTECSVSVGQGSQFEDIGFLTHLADPAGFAVELLQTTFENSLAERQELIRQRGKGTRGMGQVTIRVRGATESLQFYQEVMGMRLLSIQPVKKYGFTLYFLAHTEEAPPHPDLEAVENREWLWQRPYTTLELQHRHAETTLRLPHAQEPGFGGLIFDAAQKGIDIEELARRDRKDPDGVQIFLE